MSLLEVRGISRSFGGLVVLQEVSFDLEEGELVGLIGPNGAGKSTLLSIIAGSLAPSRGEVRFAGQVIHRLAPHRVCRLGIARTFQVPQPFAGLSVRENILAAALFGRREGGKVVVEEILEKTGLTPLAEWPAERLSVAFRKRLEFARALALAPRLLLLDEVMAGLNLKEVEGVMELIREVHRQGVTVILIEHVMKAVMGLAQRILVLHQGTLLADAPPQAIVNDPQVIAAYLGQGFGRRAR